MTETNADWAFVGSGSDINHSVVRQKATPYKVINKRGNILHALSLSGVITFS